MYIVSNSEIVWFGDIPPILVPRVKLELLG